MAISAIRVAAHITQAGLVFILVQGLAYLFYPVIGWITDVYLTRYRAIKCSLMLLLAAAIVVVLLCALVIFVLSEANLNTDLSIAVALALGSLVLLSAIFGNGLFDANAIQFGLDQLLEASTEKLIGFIHWYYWCHEIGRLVNLYIIIGAMAYLSDWNTHWLTFTRSMENVIVVSAIFGLISLVSSVISLVCFVCSQKSLYIQEAGLNPFKNMYKVLNYARIHKVPVRRSAFTYWEENIPPRIDLGKSKYGGPFTNEEVEDTKTFLRIFLLFLCLFGFHLAGGGYSAPKQLQRTSCPSLPILLLIVADPTHLRTLVVLVGVPVYRFILRKIGRCCPVRMLRRMWFGLLLSLMQTVVYTIIGSVAPEHTHFPHFTNYTVTGNCYYVLSNQSCDPMTCLQNNTYLWLIFPQVLNGLSSLLVSMTALEFVCAQAPRTTQGLLIGVWYATFSIRYLTVYVLDNFITKRRSWLIYEGVKGLLILVSLVLFSCVSRCYRYRERDEIVNIQAMIEEIYDRRQAQEDEYMKQCQKYYSRRTNYGTI